jgi:hypothetical protein
MLCRFCLQAISSILERKYQVCSHCVSNFVAKPDSISTQEWVDQFKPLHEERLSHLKKELQPITEIEDGYDS